MEKLVRAATLTLKWIKQLNWGLDAIEDQLSDLEGRMATLVAEQEEIKTLLLTLTQQSIHRELDSWSSSDMLLNGNKVLHHPK